MGIHFATAWALVVGRVASTLAVLVSSHVIAKNHVSLTWDPQAARDILAFGSGIFLSTATYFLSGEAERLRGQGKFVTLGGTGCFCIAISISSAAAGPATDHLSSIFPDDVGLP